MTVGEVRLRWVRLAYFKLFLGEIVSRRVWSGYFARSFGERKKGREESSVEIFRIYLFSSVLMETNS